MKQLVRINIEGNPLKIIKQSIRQGNTEKLKQYLAQRIETTEVNKLENINSNSKQMGEETQWQRLIKSFYSNRDLIIRKQKLNTYEDCLFELIDAKILDLSDNLYEQIDERIYKMMKLQSVRFNNNKIKGVEGGIVYLNHLVDLQL